MKPNEEKQTRKKIKIGVCTSQKSCGKNFGNYIWERACNENGITDFSLERFEVGNIVYEKTQCQGMCTKPSNIRVNVEEKENTQFSYLSPLRAAKLFKMLKSGTDPKNIKRI